MKLSQYAKKIGVGYQTVWNWYKDGLIKNAYQLPSGTIIVPDDMQEQVHLKIKNYLMTRLRD